jgi:hypothetical protein
MLAGARHRIALLFCCCSSCSRCRGCRPLLLPCAIATVLLAAVVAAAVLAAVGGGSVPRGLGRARGWLSGPRIAFAFAVRDGGAAPWGHLLAEVHGDAHVYAFHVDRRAPAGTRAAVEALAAAYENVHVVPASESLATVAGGISEVEMLLMVHERLLDLNEAWDVVRTRH